MGNRIVINFDQEQAPRPRPKQSRRPWGPPLLIIAFVLIAVVIGFSAGAFFWWRHYQSGPAYLLALLAEAAQRDDTVTVDNMIDTDKVAADLLSQARQHTTGSLSSVLPSSLDSLNSSVSTRVKQTVKNEVHAEAKRISAGAAGKPFIAVALAMPWIADVKQQDNVAQVNVGIKDERIQLTMQRDDGRWRVVAVRDDNLTKLLTSAATRSWQR